MFLFLYMMEFFSKFNGYLIIIPYESFKIS
jgi:hypothetical protein